VGVTRALARYNRVAQNHSHTAVKQHSPEENGQKTMISNLPDFNSSFDLVIDEFDGWSNPIGAAVAPTTICWGEDSASTIPANQA
jgi:hypothetical protein